uniref:Outer dense fiber protein n=1 Tax=Anoplophora glabripennis TaxID=217634 RepID=V5G788_ANOGL
MGGMTQRPWTPTKRRGPIAAEFRGPGPACVALPSYIGKKTSESKSGRAPAFSFGARHNGKLESIGPGPGQYNVTGLSAKGKDNPPALSLHGRPKEPKPENFPAPGDYDPDKAEKVIHDNAPKFTFGLKTNLEKPVDTPAPNVYTIPSAVGDKSTPAYTISGRTKEPIDERVKNPAPGQYNNVDPENYKTHSPAYTISGRTNLPRDENIPGPGVYSPEKVVLDITPAHSFGIRHSPFSDHY